MGTTIDRDAPCLHEIGPDGQQQCYLVLHKGQCKDLVQPVRHTYRHLICGVATTMGPELAETYAAQPGFYGATYCIFCRGHFPVGEMGEFVWLDGTLVGTMGILPGFREASRVASGAAAEAADELSGISGTLGYRVGPLSRHLSTRNPIDGAAEDEARVAAIEALAVALDVQTAANAAVTAAWSNPLVAEAVAAGSWQQLLGAARGVAAEKVTLGYMPKGYRGGG